MTRAFGPQWEVLALVEKVWPASFSHKLSRQQKNRSTPKSSQLVLSCLLRMKESGPGPTFIRIHNGTVTTMHNGFGPAPSPSADEVTWLEPGLRAPWTGGRRSRRQTSGGEWTGLWGSVQGTARVNASTSAPNANSLHSESAAEANALPCTS